MSLRKTILSKFDYDVAALSEEVDGRENELAVRAVTENRTMDIVSLNTDVKIGQKWKPATLNIQWQDSGCNKENEGGIVFGQKPLEAAKVAIHMELCNDHLIGFYPQYSLARGAQAEKEDLPFAEALIDYLVRENNRLVSRAIWQSDTTIIGNSNLDRFDGLAKRIVQSTTTIPAGTGVINATTALAAFRAVASARPANVQDAVDVGVIACNIVDFNFLRDNLFTLNLYHYDAESDGKTIKIPGTNCIAYVDNGVPQGYLFCGMRSDLMVNTNIYDEIMDFRVDYDKKSDLLLVKADFYLGTQIGFDDQIVKWTPVLS